MVKNSALYEKGIIYNEKELIVVDLSKYQFNMPLCSFPDDFEIRAVGDALIIENLKDCFLSNIYHDRYREWNNFKFKLPMLVEPREQVIVDAK